MTAGGRGEGSALCDVTIHVTDVNDNSPQWSVMTPLVVSLLDSRIMSLSASDLDAGHNGSVTYSLQVLRGHSITFTSHSNV